jgi:hypothetical protein
VFRAITGWKPMPLIFRSVLSDDGAASVIVMAKAEGGCTSQSCIDLRPFFMSQGQSDGEA